MKIRQFVTRIRYLWERDRDLLEDLEVLVVLVALVLLVRLVRRSELSLPVLSSGTVLSQIHVKEQGLLTSTGVVIGGVVGVVRARVGILALLIILVSAPLQS